MVAWNASMCVEDILRYFPADWSEMPAWVLRWEPGDPGLMSVHVDACNSSHRSPIRKYDCYSRCLRVPTLVLTTVMS